MFSQELPSVAIVPPIDNKWEKREVLTPKPCPAILYTLAWKQALLNSGGLLLSKYALDYTADFAFLFAAFSYDK